MRRTRIDGLTLRDIDFSFRDIPSGPCRPLAIDQPGLHTHMPAPLLRSASLTGFADIARAAGLDPARMMRAAGLNPSCLRDPESRISVAAVRRLLEATALEGNLPDLGLRMARLRRLSNLGPISLLVREQPTARSALETLLRHMRLLNESLITRVEDIGELVIIREEFALGEPAPVRQAMELAVGVMYRILRELLGPDWEPRRVCFSHNAPANLTSHIQTFGRFVEFDADFNGIVCAARDLQTRNPSADPVMARYARQYLEGLLAGEDVSTVDKVRRLVHSLLPTGGCTIEAVAGQLGVDRRTVHRQLLREGTTFSAELRNVRSELIVRYLENGNRPLSEIADALGFASLSALSRWFRASFGTSVTQWRSCAQRRHALERAGARNRR